jgi:hypothetical protein
VLAREDKGTLTGGGGGSQKDMRKEEVYVAIVRIKYGGTQQRAGRRKATNDFLSVIIVLMGSVFYKVYN